MWKACYAEPLLPTSQHVLASEGTEQPRDHHVGSEQCDKRPSRHRRHEPTLLVVGFDSRRSSVRRPSVSACCTRIASGGRIQTQARTAGSGSADESTSSPAIPVFLFSGWPPRATACLETASDCGKCLSKTHRFLGRYCDSMIPAGNQPCCGKTSSFVSFLGYFPRITLGAHSTRQHAG